MGESAFEQELRRLLQPGLTPEAQEAREALLKRCLGVLGEDVAGEAGTELDDNTLEMLAAAGEIDQMRLE